MAFAGHRYEWHCIGVENKLPKVLEDLINKGYTIFYDGHYGSFDEKCAHAVLQLKHKYPHIKLIRILTYYHHDKEKYDLPSCYDGPILPEIEELHYKQKITKRNEWVIDHCDILVCHMEERSLSHLKIRSKANQTNNLHLTKKKTKISLILYYKSKINFFKTICILFNNINNLIRVLNSNWNIRI